MASLTAVFRVSVMAAVHRRLSVILAPSSHTSLTQAPRPGVATAVKGAVLHSCSQRYKKKWSGLIVKFLRIFPICSNKYLRRIFSKFLANLEYLSMFINTNMFQNHLLFWWNICLVQFFFNSFVECVLKWECYFIFSPDLFRTFLLSFVESLFETKSSSKGVRSPKEFVFKRS